MEKDFIADLDEYFAKNYCNYDIISALPSYKAVTVSMLLRNYNRVENGEQSADERKKICSQPEKEQLLIEFKQKYTDTNFSYSFRLAPVRRRLAVFLRFRRCPEQLKKTVVSHGEDLSGFAAKLEIDPYIWKNILRGYYLPEKVLLFKIFLLLGCSGSESSELMNAFGYAFDNTDARDVVVRYLIDYRIFNEEMIAAAFDEYKLRRIV